MEQIHVGSPHDYAIGSRTRSLLHFSALLVSVLGTLAILYLVILQLIRQTLGDGEENTFFALTLLAGGILYVLMEALLFRRIPGWLAFAVRDSAAGFVDNLGFRYRLLFKWHAVPWKDISRIEYFPGDNGRIYAYVFGSPFPIRFGPTNPTGRMPVLPDFLKSQMHVLNRAFIEHTSSARLSDGNRNQKRELIAQALVMFSVLVWLGSVSLRRYYSYTRPRLAEVSEGRIYKQSNDGYSTYLTANENNLLDVLEFSAPILLLGGMLLHPKKRTWQPLRW